MSAKLFSIVVMIFLAVAFGLFLIIDSLNDKVSEATGLVVSIDSFPTYLETHPAISSMPKSATIGIKIGDSSYEIEGRDVKSASALTDKDVIVYLPAGYETIIGELGLCNAVKKAYNDKDIKVDVFASRTKLLLKYGKLLKYNDCVN